MARVLFFLQLIVVLVVLPLWPGLDTRFALWGSVSLAVTLALVALGAFAVYGLRACAQAARDAWSPGPLGASADASWKVWDLVARLFPVAGLASLLPAVVGPLSAGPDGAEGVSVLTVLLFGLLWVFCGLLLSRILGQVVRTLGERVVTNAGPVELTPAVADRFALTPRELEVARRQLDGLTYLDTAKELGIGLATVKSHLLSVYRKTGTGNKLELLRLVEAETARLHRSAERQTPPPGAR